MFSYLGICSYVRREYTQSEEHSYVHLTIEMLVENNIFYF